MIRKHARLIAVGACCLAVGAGASVIAGAGAASSTPVKGGHAIAGWHRHGGGLARLAGRTVSGNLVVRTRIGFVTVSFERGTIDSVSGQQLKITEGTRRAAYRSVTVTIPADARIRDDGSAATISSLKAGQRVIVIRAPRRTFVLAHTPRAG